MSLTGANGQSIVPSSLLQLLGGATMPEKPKHPTWDSHQKAPQDTSPLSCWGNLHLPDRICSKGSWECRTWLDSWPMAALTRNSNHWAAFSMIAMCHGISKTSVSRRGALAASEQSGSFFKLGNCRLPRLAPVKPEGAV